MLSMKERKKKKLLSEIANPILFKNFYDSIAKSYIQQHINTCSFFLQYVKECNKQKFDGERYKKKRLCFDRTISDHCSYYHRSVYT